VTLCRCFDAASERYDTDAEVEHGKEQEDDNNYALNGQKANAKSGYNISIETKRAREGY